MVTLKMSDPILQARTVPEDEKMEHNTTSEQEIPRHIIRQNILKLAWPVILELGLVTLVEVADMIMVGRVGVESLTAIGITLQPLMLAMVIFNGLSVGTTALVARFIGEKNNELANRTFNQSVAGATMLALVMSIGLFFIAPFIMTWMGAENSTIVKLGTGYIRWMIPGLLLQWQFAVISSAMRGAGDTKTPMYVNGLINVINMFGNYFLIFGFWIFPRMEIIGAALASSIARICGFILLLILIRYKNTILKLNRRDFLNFDWPLMKRVVKIGIPAALEQAALRIGQLFYTRIVNSLGTVAIAAHNTAINAESLSYMPGWGFSVAATTMVGQKLGEKKPQEAQASGIESLKFGISIMACMALVFLIFPETLIRLYTKASDPNAQELIRLGARNLRIIALAQIPMGIQFVLAGALRGAGYTKPVLYSTIVGVWVGRLLGAYIFVVYLGWGLLGAWIAMNIDWFLRCFYVIYLWKKGQWKKVEV